VLITGGSEKKIVPYESTKELSWSFVKSNLTLYERPLVYEGPSGTNPKNPYAFIKAQVLSKSSPPTLGYTLAKLELDGVVTLDKYTLLVPYLEVNDKLPDELYMFSP
jgi:hypothetical protein